VNSPTFLLWWAGRKDQSGPSAQARVRWRAASRAANHSGSTARPPGVAQPVVKNWKCRSAAGRVLCSRRQESTNVGRPGCARTYVAGTWSDRFGRKPVLLAGWLIAIPVPLMLIWAPAWGWVVAASVLLGANQGLTWSTTVIMKIDLAGPSRRGLAMGLNEAFGYLALALTALGYLAARYGLRPTPFLLGLSSVASVSACPRRPSAKPATTHASKPRGTRRPPN
jgi:hypothetical protein